MTFTRTLSAGSFACFFACSSLAFAASSSDSFFRRAFSSRCSAAILSKFAFLAAASFLATSSALRLAPCCFSKTSRLENLSDLCIAISRASSCAAAARARSSSGTFFSLSCLSRHFLIFSTSAARSASCSARLAATASVLALSAARAAFRAASHFVRWAAWASLARSASATASWRLACAASARCPSPGLSGVAALAACFSASCGAAGAAAAAASGSGAATGAASPWRFFQSKLSHAGQASAFSAVLRWKTAEAGSGNSACNSRTARPERAKVMAWAKDAREVKYRTREVRE
mmetsp:Transcript_89873/g.268126  ORF Transcript_89873/g.268126 Transcript_89873/m.268126 type:complete len:291 (-) Transcript_89873:19-891(-)